MVQWRLRNPDKFNCREDVEWTKFRTADTLEDAEMIARVFNRAPDHHRFFEFRVKPPKCAAPGCRSVSGREVVDTDESPCPVIDTV